VGTGSFLAPMTNQPVTDQLKNGQVLPVKVSIVDCYGKPILGLLPTIALKAGDQTIGVDDTTPATIAVGSVSSADADGVMRQASDGTYIYNMKVNFATNTLPVTYTVVIAPFGTGSSYPAAQTLRHRIIVTK
jgi:hypothetical protein